MTRLRVAVYDSTAAINALARAGIACEVIQLGNVVHLEVAPGDVRAARVAVKEWRLLWWWERAWEGVGG